MKKQFVFSLLLVFMLLVTGCAAGSQSSAPSPMEKSSSGGVEISFPFVRQSGIATNQFAVWIEDAQGKFVKTLFVTKFTARGGYQSRKEALKTWVQRSNIAGMSKDEIDAVSGSTPRSGDLVYTWDCTDQNGAPATAGEYRFLVEGTLFWESSVLYTGTIAIGESGESTVSAVAEYSPEDEKNKDMIGAVKAAYFP